MNAAATTLADDGGPGSGRGLIIAALSHERFTAAACRNHGRGLVDQAHVPVAHIAAQHWDHQTANKP